MREITVRFKVSELQWGLMRDYIVNRFIPFTVLSNIEEQKQDTKSKEVIEDE